MSVPSFTSIRSPFNFPCSDTDKRIHQSWGGDDGNTELKVEEAATVDAAAESGGAGDWAGDAPAANEWGAPDAGADAWAVPAPDAAAPATTPVAEGEKPEGRPRREREPEEEDNTLTLDQYLAQQKEKDAVIPKLENTRKANEGADANIWKDVVPLSKNEEENAYFVGKVIFLICITFSAHLNLPISPRTRINPVRRKKKKYSSKSMRVLSVQIVVGVEGVVVVIVEVTAETEAVVVVAVVVQGAAARMVTPPSMSTIKLLSRPCLKALIGIGRWVFVGT